MSAAPSCSVILAAYRQPESLELVLAGYGVQRCRDFELLVADDGSGAETRAVVEVAARRLPVPVRHVWQEDRGFRKAQACNRAALASRGRWLLFSDGDCVPDPDLVAVHCRAARPGRFVVGGQVPLSLQQSAAVDHALVTEGRVGSLVAPAQRRRLWQRQLQGQLYRMLGHRRRPKFYGRNFSVARREFEALNGFDHRYGAHGREDSDLRNRMRARGLRAVVRWWSARVYHLWHPPAVGRGASPELEAYYRRRPLAPVAEQGLRALVGEPAGGRRCERARSSPIAVRDARASVVESRP